MNYRIKIADNSRLVEVYYTNAMALTMYNTPLVATRKLSKRLWISPEFYYLKFNVLVPPLQNTSQSELPNGVGEFE